MHDQLCRWEPIKGLVGRYDIQELTDVLDGLTIVMVNQQHILRIVYANSLYNFWKLNYAVKDNQVGSNWSFFKVINSSYLDWLSEQSLENSDFFNFLHFALIGENARVDILFGFEPHVEIVEGNL